MAYRLNLKRKRFSFWVLMVSLGSDPIINSIHAIFSQVDENLFVSNVSFAQFTRGFFLFVFLFILIVHYNKRITAPKIQCLKFILPLLLLSSYALIMTPFSLYPEDGLVWSLRVLYIAVIFIISCSLRIGNILQYKSLKSVAIFIVCSYVISQMIMIFGGKPGIEIYRTDFGSFGFVSNPSILVL